MAQILLLTASISGALAVCLGAFAAHGLKARLSAELLSAFRTGVDYHFYHTFAIFVVALLLKYIGHSALLNAAGWLFVLGILLFSGSLYAMALGGPKWLGPITPLGGLCFIVGWACIACAVATNNTF